MHGQREEKSFEIEVRIEEITVVEECGSGSFFAFWREVVMEGRSKEEAVGRLKAVVKFIMIRQMMINN